MVRYPRSLALLLTLVALPALANVQRADPDTLFRRAQDAYEQGDYKSVVTHLRPLLYPTNRLSASEKLIEAHKMLGVSYVFERERSKAEESFYAILSEDPSYSLDPLIDPPAAVTVFEEVKQRNAERLRQVERRQRAERERSRAARLRRTKETLAELVIERETEHRSYWINFVPFGAGQFQNDQRAKGFVLLGLQAVLGAVSLGSALALRLAYPDSRPPEEELGRARGLNVAMVSSGALFWATALYGIIDALVYYEPVKTLRERRRQRGRAVSLIPSVAPQGAAVSLEMSF